MPYLRFSAATVRSHRAVIKALRCDPVEPRRQAAAHVPHEAIPAMAGLSAGVHTLACPNTLTVTRKS